MKPGLIICICTIIVACGPTWDDSAGERVPIVLGNYTDVRLDDALVVFDRTDLDDSLFTTRPSPVAVRDDGEHETLAGQWSDLNGDGTPDELTILVSLNPEEEVTMRFEDSDPDAAAPAKRTHAEISVKSGGSWNNRVYEGGDFAGVQALRVPPEHTDHSYYIRYEGPGWESDKVGYRFYLDWRNATDIFGKKVPDLVLNEVGLDGFDSYHEMADWGMDILKVGESLGIGSPGRWSEGRALRIAETDSLHCAVILDGPVKSMIRTTYHGWQTPGIKTTVISDLSIAAGSRMTRHDLNLSRRIDSLCTGIVKHPDTEVLVDTTETTWGYLATWGKQSLAEDLLGLAVFFRNDAVLAISEDEHSEVVALAPARDNTLTYWFAACWEQEPGGITTRAEFQEYLDESIQRLAYPVSWEMQTSE